jgi:protein-S-isoprenylcysteine O-methyltransferase Ste14
MLIVVSGQPVFFYMAAEHDVLPACVKFPVGDGFQSAKSDVMTDATAGERGANVRFPPPLVFLGLTLLGVGLRYAVGLLRPSGSWATGLGIVILLAGLTMGVSARTLVVRTGQSPIPWKPTPELVFRGPYRFTRNPMYMGLTFIQTGLGFALGNLWISILAPVALLVVHLIAVLPEEQYLAQKFGASYRDYCQRVRRYL